MNGHSSLRTRLNENNSDLKIKPISTVGLKQPDDHIRNIAHGSFGRYAVRPIRLK